MPDPTAILADWKAKTDAATEGPWQYEHGYESWVRADAARGRNNESGLVCEGAWEGDAEFIAMSRSAFPKLLAAVESVLALCESPYEVPFEDSPPEGGVLVSDIRNAITDALNGGE